MIDRYLLRYFLAVVDQGGFSRAAVSCRVSQPTLSVGIAKLERIVGAPLFNRTNRRVELTEVGARFVDHARRIEAAFGAAEGVAQSTEARPLIRLGVLSTLPGRWLETALTRLRREAPDERVEIIEAAQKELNPLLSRGRIDLALGIVGADPRARQRLFSEPYALALSPAHRFADRDSVRGEDLAEDTMIVRRHCEALPEISRHFTRRGVRPFMAARTVSDDRALSYVRSGLGLTVMPRCFAGEGVAMPLLAGFDQTREIGFLIEPDSVQRVERTRAADIIADTYRAAAEAV
ncbi:MAG: LysR family transcriptional regulator [Brevundimonas sp.]|nr:LysR family transcriptional regulator [Brevundimonas sp.]